MKKKTSIGGWAHIWGGYQHDPIPLQTVLEALSGQGFDGIEMATFPLHLEPNTEKSRKQIRKMLLDYGPEVSGVVAPFPSPTTAKNNDYFDVVKRYLDSLIEKFG